MSIRRLIIAAACAAGAFIAPVAAAQQVQPAPAPALADRDPEALPRPFFHPVRLFGRYGPDNAPTGGALTAAEEMQLLQATSALERFAPYLFSGCHDRAQAAYMMLPAALRPKLMKIWIVAPARYTAGIGGRIELVGEDADSRAVKWGYHVALAWEGPDGLKIFDAALRPGQILNSGQWFGLMRIPHMAFWTLTRGNLYQFFYSDLDPTTNTADYVWNGNAFNYEDITTSDTDVWDQQTVPMNLARDAVGVQAMTDPTVCDEVREQVREPGRLLDILQAASPPTRCAASIRLFRAEWRRWAARLGHQPLTR